MKTLPRATTEIVRSYYHTPLAGVLAAFPVVLRAGHLRAAAGYAIERRCSQGHDLLLCLAGRGEVRIGNRAFSVGKGDLAWIDGYRPHSHRADPAEPWELYWLRTDGPGLGALRDLLGVGENPVFRGGGTTGLRAAFRQLLRELEGTVLHREERVYVWLARLVAILRRLRPHAAGDGGAAVPAEIELVLNRMALYPQQGWTTAALARLARLSVAQFHRRFRQVTGSSPIDWLRRQRINLAKRRLVESADAVKTVADHAGYHSPYFFSRDFKRYTGLSPTEFRRQEQRGS